MKQFKSISCLAIFVILSNFYFGQTVNITDANLMPLDCANFNNGAAANFTDDGAAANYGANRRDTITICPNLPNGPKLILTFATDQGFSFDVEAQDTIYVFDGPNVSSPLLGTLNSGINPNGGTFNSSFENNPSGCLTIVFHSNATVEGTGWDANISCGSTPQPFYPHIEAFVNGVGPNALNPIDTGYVDICFGDSILLVSKPLFPYSLEANGYGYSQNMNNVTHNWEFSNGVVGPDNDSIWFTPNIRGGFYLGLIMTDAFPQIEQTFCKIRVSQYPIFTAGPLVNPICVHEEGIILGGASSQDTVGIQFPPGSFTVGGTVAGLTYLPDGSGQNYTTTITMDDFPAGATFSDAADLQNVCLTMEHSFLGDLEVWLTCPNGTEIGLINAYDPGHLANGFGGGGTFLGDADDNGNGTPGIGWEYCFSTVNATLGTMGDESAANNTLPTTISSGDAMTDQGIYLPETTFAGFAGCPLNGDWTITVRDNQGIDDGYIFEWGLFFNGNLFPNTETYTNFITEDHWTDHPTIVDYQDTAIVVYPDVPGNYNYTFNVTDDYGCHYDTTVQITVKPGIILNMTSPICNDSLTSVLNTGTNDGVWSVIDSPAMPTVAQDDINTTFGFPVDGTYFLVYSDTSCLNKDTSEAIIIDTKLPTLITTDYTSCEGGVVVITTESNIGAQFLSWDTGSTGFTTEVTQSGVYYVTAQNSCGTEIDSSVVQFVLCELDMPNVFTPGNTDNLNTNDVFRVLVPSDVFTTFSCQIFNRWGNLMYEYTDVFGGWDGKVDGKEANGGVYFYKVNAVTFTGIVFERHGILELIRP